MKRLMDFLSSKAGRIHTFLSTVDYLDGKKMFCLPFHYQSSQFWQNTFGVFNYFDIFAFNNIIIIIIEIIHLHWFLCSNSQCVFLHLFSFIFFFFTSIINIFLLCELVLLILIHNLVQFSFLEQKKNKKKTFGIHVVYDECNQGNRN